MSMISARAQGLDTVFPTDKEVAEMDRKFSDHKIVVENNYYPKPGKFEEVLTLRIAASKLLKEFGLSPGKITVARQTKDSAKGKQAEVAAIVWSCEYKNLVALEKEISSLTLEQESRFQKEILQKMKTHTTRHKRTSSYVVND